MSGARCRVNPSGGVNRPRYGFGWFTRAPGVTDSRSGQSPGAILTPGISRVKYVPLLRLTSKCPFPKDHPWTVATSWSVAWSRSPPSDSGVRRLSWRMAGGLPLGCGTSWRWSSGSWPDPGPPHAATHPPWAWEVALRRASRAVPAPGAPEDHQAATYPPGTPGAPLDPRLDRLAVVSPAGTSEAPNVKTG